MKKILKITALTTVCLVIVCAAGILGFRSQLIAHYSPAVEQIGEIKIKATNDSCLISSRLTVENRAFFDIKMDTIKYKVSVFNKTYLENVRSLGIDLQPYDKDTIDFSLKIPYAALLKDIRAQRKLGDSASYMINIFLQYSTILGTSELPINKVAKIKLPQPPEMEIVEINCTRIRFRSIRADARIKVVNYSDISLNITDMNYSMKISDQGDLKGKYPQSFTIKPRATTYLSIPIEINVDNIGKTAFQVLMNKDKYNYILKLRAVLKSVDPIARSFDLDLEKSGRMELKK